MIMESIIGTVVVATFAVIAFNIWYYFGIIQAYVIYIGQFGWTNREAKQIKLYQDLANALLPPRDEFPENLMVVVVMAKDTSTAFGRRDRYHRSYLSGYVATLVAYINPATNGTVITELYLTSTLPPNIDKIEWYQVNHSMFDKTHTFQASDLVPLNFSFDIDQQLLSFYIKNPRIHEMFKTDLLDWIGGQHPDCGPFAAWLLKKRFWSDVEDYFSDGAVIWTEKYKVNLKNADKLFDCPPGTCIYLKSKSGSFHYAVVLNDDMCISKLGQHGIVLTTQKQLLGLYQMSEALCRFSNPNKSFN